MFMIKKIIQNTVVIHLSKDPWKHNNHSLMNILNYLFEVFCLANQQMSFDKLYGFNYKTVTLNQNAEKGIQSISY